MLPVSISVSYDGARCFTARIKNRAGSAFVCVYMLKTISCILLYIKCFFAASFLTGLYVCICMLVGGYVLLTPLGPCNPGGLQAGHSCPSCLSFTFTHTQAYSVIHVSHLRSRHVAYIPPGTGMICAFVHAIAQTMS